MASPEHIELSNFIKNVHINLRNSAKKVGFNKAWQEHMKNNEILEEYAQSMKKLAQEYWDKNSKTDEKVISRITWVYENCQKYYQEELIRQRNREIEALNKINIDKFQFKSLNNEKYKVLDVGSCYNPFNIYENLSVTAIDIAPSCKNVYKCDFINLEISDLNKFNDNTLISLEKESFNIVIFSLLLEYIPSAEKRLQCCKNAYALLDFEGILIIITPDSKHVGANVKYMKSWRYVLASLGFSRIKYEKLPYIHCMIFRKAINIEFGKRWVKMHANDGLDDSIYIPQDFQNS